MADTYNFPRDVRIRDTRDYREHRRRSRIFRTRTFLVAWAPGQGQQGRVGLTTSKKKVGSAPARNRTRRLLREWYRLHRQEFDAPWDLVVIAQTGAAEMDLKGVEQELGELIAWLNRKTAQERA